MMRMTRNHAICLQALGLSLLLVSCLSAPWQQNSRRAMLPKSAYTQPSPNGQQPGYPRSSFPSNPNQSGFHHSNKQGLSETGQLWQGTQPNPKFQSRSFLSGNFLPKTFFKQISPTSWRSRIQATKLFPLIQRHLMKSYILLQSDHVTHNIQTDWDKFFLGGRLFRNRMSVSLFQVSLQETEIVITNKLEYFQQEEERQSFGESDWIPTQDITNEKIQLIQSVSHTLNAMNTAAHNGLGPSHR